MNFITFGTQFTNLFPASNTTAGGQLVTEFNLKSRESVGTDSKITYPIGPSYTHCNEDWEISILADAGGMIINSYTISIAPGRGVINGHYVETLIPMTIDLVEANAKLAAQSQPILKGTLGVGIRTFFATDQTIAGSILVENEDDMFLGIQIVILPVDEIVTPSDSPLDQSKVNCDLKLGQFNFFNNVISALSNYYEGKLEWILPERVKALDDVVSDTYITKFGLNSKKLYAFAGKGTDPETGLDTWEDVTDSMMVWDNKPQRTPELTTYKQAEIVTTSTGSYMVIPHKQVTGMTDDEGDPEYYEPRVIQFPVADYSTSTVGYVSKSYTDHIKNLALEFSNFRTTLHGKQIKYMDIRSTTDELPQINDGWDYGDYVLIGIDEYYSGGAGDEAQPPATMYVVLPGVVQEISFIASLDGDVNDEPGIPDYVLGAEIDFMEWYEASGQALPDTQHPEYYPQFFVESDGVRGIPRDTSTGDYYDYFRLRYYKTEPDPDNPTYPFTDYFYGVSKSGPRAWSDAVRITGEIPFATEETIGGFLNASEEALDYGYVFLDDTGHLRLRDYALLRSGTLAYQIGSNITVPSDDGLSGIQAYLDEYVNERVAFPSNVAESIYSPVIHIYLNIPAADEATTLVIKGIDSRFNTAVCIHVDGSAGSNVTLNIMDCEKVIIDPTINGTPVINIFRSCLYYDPIVFNYIKSCIRDSATYGTFTGFKDLKLWYEQLNSDSPSLLVDGMTVSELDSPIITSDINYWKEFGTAANDNNYFVALRSISFSGAGDIVGCEVLAANNSTDNVDPGDKIVVGNFTLPQGENLIYPEVCLTRNLKVDGSFTSAYYSDGSWYVTDNSFTLQTGVYTLLTVGDTPKTVSGTIAFHSVTTLVPSTLSQTSINVWEPDSYHIFRGGAIS